MKTLFVLVVRISMFYSVTSIYGYIQPSHAQGSARNGLNVDSVFKRCEEFGGDIRTRNFLDQDFLLCFGLKVISQQFHDITELTSILDGVEKKSDTEFCKHFQEMRLNLPNNSVADMYNMQFHDKNKCERACLDVMDNVNPLCSIILLLNHHSKGSPNGNVTQAPSTTLAVGITDNGDNEVPLLKMDSNPSRKMIEDVSSNIPNKQKPKAIDEKGVINVQMPNNNVKEQIPDGLKPGLNNGQDKSNTHKTEITPMEQTPQKVKSVLPYEGTKLHGQKEHNNATGVGSDKGKQKLISEGEAQVAESAKSANLKDTATSRTQGLKDITPVTNTANNTLKESADSKKEPTGNTAEATNVSIKNKNQEKSVSLMGKNAPVPSLVEIPKSSGGNKNETAATAGTKSQETISVGEDSVASKKVVAETDVQKDGRVSQVTNVEKVKEIINGPKSQSDNKETENPPLKEAELQVSSKTTIEEIPESNIEEIPESNIEEQKTNKNSEKAETVPQSGRDGQETVGEEMQFTDDSGDSVPGIDTQFSVEAGESIDNTEFPSGGGTGVDYANPGSDVLDTDKNNMPARPVVIHDKYDDDSHFFAYFMTTMVFCIVGYLVFHNKQKILALALEGRARRGRRRPNTSGYRKLDSNLEEAISSSKSASVTQVIY